MASLFDIEIAEKCDLGYLNIREPSSDAERKIHIELEQMWAIYAPFAEPNFKKDFSLEPQSHFWEMKLTVDLVKSGYEVLPYDERQHPKGAPDICFIHDGKKLWIEAVAPKTGEGGPNSVTDQPAMVFSKNKLEIPEHFLRPRPSREISLRIASAFSSKLEIAKNYILNGVIPENEIILIAISGGNFLGYASDDPPDIITSLIPAGDHIAVYDPTNNLIVKEGYEYSKYIPKTGTNSIPRDLLLSNNARHISGVIWSRTSIGNMARSERPTSVLSNPNSQNAAPRLDGFCDRHYHLLENDEGLFLNQS